MLFRPSTEDDTNILDSHQYFLNNSSNAYNKIVDACDNDWHNLVLTNDAGQTESKFSHYFNGNLMGERIFLNSVFMMMVLTLALHMILWEGFLLKF